MIRSMVMLALALMTAGCGGVMSAENLKQVDRSLSYEALQANPGAAAGRMVMVGGVIVGVVGSGDVTTLEVSQLKLLSGGIPDEQSPSAGRFLALTSQLSDPAGYTPGQLVSLIGEVKGVRVQKRDTVEYAYPLIAIRELHLFAPASPMPADGNPYRSQFGDSKFLGRPPGLADGEPRRSY